MNTWTIKFKHRKNEYIITREYNGLLCDEIDNMYQAFADLGIDPKKATKKFMTCSDWKFWVGVIM